MATVTFVFPAVHVGVSLGDAPGSGTEDTSIFSCIKHFAKWLSHATHHFHIHQQRIRNPIFPRSCQHVVLTDFNFCPFWLVSSSTSVVGSLTIKKIDRHFTFTAICLFSLCEFPSFSYLSNRLLCWLPWILLSVSSVINVFSYFLTCETLYMISFITPKLRFNSQIDYLMFLGFFGARLLSSMMIYNCIPDFFSPTKF